MSSSRSLRSLKDRCVGGVKRVLKRESSLEPEAQHTTAEPMPSTSRWYSKRTPKWNDALERWRNENEEAYLELEKLAEGLVKSPIERTAALAQLQPASTSSKQIVARLKRWQSTLGAVRGIVMSVAAHDPHKILPIICASAFFGIDILFNNMHPEERDKVLDILFDCGNTIREYVSFEMNFSQRGNPVIESDISAVEELLSDQYIRALRLVFDIQRWCKEVERSYDSRRQKWEDWVSIRGRNLWRSFTGKFTAWESDANEIKRQKTRWTSMKKDLEDKLSADKHNVEVQKWIKKDGDPEPQIGTIKRRVMPDGNYEDAAKWFLDTSQFRAWCDNFREPESPPAAKRVLWVRGTYGTGKTTLLYHTYTALKEEPEFNLGNRSVRIVPYFCDANKAGTTRPDYNTVIRALIRHLSLLPDFTLSKLALDKYSRDPNPRSQGDDVDIGEWEDLFKELVVEGADEYHFVFVVDALDECLNLKEAEHFLYFMSKKVMPLCPNVHLLCSSRQQVRVNDHFSEERRHDVEVTSAVTALEMKKFITGELARRRSISKDSVFYTPQNTDLLGNLQKLLLDHARGMFRWVQIWLDILLPVLDDQKTIRKRETATEWLENLRSDVTHKHGAEQQLESGYQRLWGFNDILGFEDQRIRLFQIVLAAFEPQAPENLREALRIQGSTYNQDLTTEQVKRLYSNFLYEDRRSDHWKTGKELRFVHESARKFILNMKYLDGSEKDDEAQFSERKNHLAVANLYIDVVGLLTHPFWQANGLEPSNWTEILTTSPKATRLKQDLRTWSHHDTAFYVYLVKYGLRHCDLAARKRSMFDDIWSKVLDRVILAPVSAFGFTMLVDESIVFSDPKFIDQDWLYVLGESEGHIKLFPSHALAGLNIIHEDDLSRLQLPTGEPCGVFESQARQRRLFEHAACVGNNFPPNDFRSHSGTENALQIACNTKNRAAVDMILQATESLSSNSVNSIILATQDRHYNSPIAIAIRKHSFAAGRDPSYFHIIETLLKFGRCNSSMRGVSSRLHLAAGPYISKQWSLESSNNASSGPALHLVAELFEEHQISHLLSIARPEDINTRDRWGCSILHIAAMRGFLGLTRELVEEYDADIEAKTIDGWTPSYLALGTKEEELVKYFKSRGANFDFEAVKED